MAQIGYGYGSEFQLLRFLGHHRHLLEEEISKQISEKGIFNWLDFGFANRENSISGDEELKGLSFLQEKGIIDNSEFDKIKEEYSSYKINNYDNWQNWDAVFVLNDTIYLVEAKAHVGEISSGNTIHGGESSSKILRYMKDLLPTLNVTETWLMKYYQLGNRLATTSLLNKYGIKCKTLCIFFCNGYLKRVIEKNKIYKTVCKDATKEMFLKAIKKEKETLNIVDADISSLLAPPVFIEANPK